ncbi:MAG: enoyl-CoA hydratase/isomerase family protein [Deltaproteobacteria bacterium]|jgi:enoyl-CoA hydratase|nr:enoyl-CoA hydratase/isomerase family protein [Deltaproteobacteria bacterium]
MAREDFIHKNEAGVSLIEISREKVMNALDSEAVLSLSSLIAEIAEAGPRCLVLTGAGPKAFVAGADLKEMEAMGRSQAENLCSAGNELMRRISDFPAPVIAAVNGYAIGGGFELALACDIRLASDKAVFSLPEVSFGIIPGYGGLQRLSRLIGRGRASELAYTARRLSAAEALEWGVVSRVFKPEELMSEAMKMAETIAAMPPLAIASAKKVLTLSEGLEASKSHLLERGGFGSLFGTWDQREAMAAFAEKRKPPPFKG